MTNNSRSNHYRVLSATVVACSHCCETHIIRSGDFDRAACDLPRSVKSATSQLTCDDIELDV